ncbi:Long-chain fatty acid transport protein 6 [Acipenser ruthenus]|uniref:long-chain-fatty-acid--CoA ligase n=1 Tax=Acipenser ruthenus TaxID=7906 RepID=A0A662YTE2_ACIRT|nr:long-chain fatty acid transport protein 6 isoform X1 [Acipenser ruthenus]XP_058878281.1 long-chain fatty acid transport protein 6-like isoform X1 [Acipenser ruthenus]RXM99415.1 Long-chain fatty acid transport protein 6 [Acipenser ruthenus]
MFSAWITALIAGVSTLVIQKLFFPYFWIDLKYLTKVISYGIKIEIYKKTAKVVTVLDRFMQQAQKIPNKPFIIYEDNAFTYQDVDKRSNQVAQVFFKQGVLKKGDTVALLMSNEPDFINVWFGLCKLGCAVAFLNFNIKSRSLLHCFNSCGAKTLVVGSDMTDTLEDILPNLHEDNISVWIMASESHQPGINTILDKLEDAPDEPVPAHLRATDSVKTPTLYIFTSGTTGLPKAAVISQLQSLKGAAGLWAYGATADDIVYVTLPLYHSAASLLGVGGCIELGATFVLKKKFSASQFWSDCRKYNVTVFQYIGEICRYLCNMPKKEGEKDHKVRMGVGNGVQQNIWKEFLDRFGDIKLCELYGSTEGNVCFMNHVGKIGAVGRSNFFYKRISKYCLVKYDLENGEIILNEQGFCEEVKKGEAGLLLSQINSISPFFGYAGSKSLTEKKLLRDVFKKGDVYLNTGDLMVEDHEDFIYFNDRIGDTFRWKGENVSTTEVADVVGIIDFLQEANIYGVSVPGYEGKAGMAAVVLNPGCGFDGKSLYEHVENYLPGYARPRFVRIQKSMEITGTFKQQKFRLVESGFNPSTITDSLYFLDESQKCYVPLTTEIFDIIASGQIKL